MKRREGSVIAAPDPGTVARLADQLAHRVQEVDVVAGEIMDVLQRREGRHFQPVIADEPTDDGPILLFNMARVVLGIRPTPREGDALVGAVANQQPVDELTPLSLSRRRMGNGRSACSRCKPEKTVSWRRSRNPAQATQPVATSTMLSVYRN